MVKFTILSSMLIKTPKFWLEKNFISYLLLPLSLIYLAVTTIINFCKEPYKSTKPIICIGNITVGGSGKTPVALEVGKILRDAGINFCYLSRGYKAKEDKFGFVNVALENAEKTGDEPLLLAEIAPTFIAKNRFDGVKEIEKNEKIQAIIIDDGMQNNSIKADALFLVIDAKVQFGNGFLFPAGPLREKLASGLKKADFVIVIGDKNAKLRRILRDKKVIKAQIKEKNIASFLDQKLIAFCGLAYPQKFFSYLEEQGLEVVDSKPFSDHHFYSENQLQNLLDLAHKKNAKLITTKKDWVKFPQKFKEKISYLDIELELENKGFVRDEIMKFISKNK